MASGKNKEGAEAEEATAAGKGSRKRGKGSERAPAAPGRAKEGATRRGLAGKRGKLQTEFRRLADLVRWVATSTFSTRTDPAALRVIRPEYARWPTPWRPWARQIMKSR